MKSCLFIVSLLFGSLSYSQLNDGLSSQLEQQLEMEAQGQEEVLDDDAYLRQREEYEKHPLDLNRATENDLKELLLLNTLQVDNFLKYRKLLGKLLSVYELQSVPGWNVAIIRKLLPFVKAGPGKEITSIKPQHVFKGEHSILFRTGMLLEKARGFQQAGNTGHFTGSRPGAYFRYDYKLRNVVEWGIKADKDPGEPLFRGKQKAGFDFYSAYACLRKQGIIRAFILGDFTVNLGQGLMQWQTLAFKKSADLNNLKRQSAVLRPYTSSGEFNFHRGIGMTLQRRRWEGSAFVSVRKLSGNLVRDTLTGERTITSLSESGYHRTPGETADRNNISQLTVGGSVKYTAPQWHLAANGIRYLFSNPFRRKGDPYNMFDTEGRDLVNAGLDYSFTHHNIHFFGEVAMDKNTNGAFLNGMLVALDPKIDVSVLQRSIDKAYRALYANAMTENTVPANENGLFAGVSLRPFPFLEIDAYKDAFRFPWLRYRVDAPSGGDEYFIRLSYKPDKRVTLYSRFIHEVKESNGESGNDVLPKTGNMLRQNWRVQSDMLLNKYINLRTRLEVCWYKPEVGMREQGFLFFQDLAYTSPLIPLSLDMRLVIFETNSYNSRVYAFESQGGTAFSIPVFFGKGYQYHLNLHCDLSRLFNQARGNTRKVATLLHFSRTVYPGKTSIGSGPGEITGNTKTEVKMQLQLAF